ncbi:MAG TPA: Calx-beta domain-containing protein, partial [Pyrinomonadaceae bacterium]
MPRTLPRRAALPALMSLLALSLTVIGAAASAPGSISFTSASYSVGESDGSASITLSRSGGTDGAVTAKVTPSNGTAGSGDYRFTPGAIDGTFNFNGSGPDYDVSVVTILPDGKILIGGSFSRYNGTHRNNVARLNSDGSLDTTFAPPVSSGTVACLAAQPDGKVVVGGSLSHGNDSTPRTGITRLNADGTTDTSFNPGTGARTEYGPTQVIHVAVQPDGKIVIGGQFTFFNGVSRNGLARLNSDGSLDNTFNVGQGPLGEYGSISSMLLQPDGKLLVGGAFLRFDWADRDGIVRLNSDGTVDTTFEPRNSTQRFFVYGLALQPDGKVVAGGGFYPYINHNGANPTAITRYNADGSADNTFNDPGLGTLVLTQWIVRQPDGKLIIGGNRRLLTPNGELRHSLYRLNADGTKDTTFNDAGIPALGTGYASAAAMQPDGRILVGGLFPYNPSNPADRRFFYRLDGDLFVNWAAGDAADKTVSLPVVGDTLSEEDETVNFTVTPLTGGATAGAVPAATLTILDDDPVIRFPGATFSVGENAGSVNIPIERVGGTTRQSSVTYTVSAHTASANDFTASTGTLTFAPGETSKNITVNVNDDLVNERDEQFFVDLTNFTGAAVGLSHTAVTILNDDPLPTLAVEDVTVTEGNAGQSVANFKVTRTGAIDRDVLFTATTEDGTAVAGEDYNRLGGAGFFIAPGADSVNVPVEILNDTNIESDKSFALNISAPVNATITRARAVGVIKDNDTNAGPTTFQFPAREFRADEGAGIATVTITRTGDNSAPAEVFYTTVQVFAGAGFASPRSDYTRTFGRLLFAPGETSKTFNIFVTDDAFVEGDETLRVELFGPDASATGWPSQADLRIIDNDTVASAVNPIDNSAFFVRQHYRDFLNRDPDASGFAFWTNEIESCGSDAACREVKRVNVSAAFFLSIEFQQTGYVAYLKNQLLNINNAGERMSLGTFQSDMQELSRGVVVGAPNWEEALEANKRAYFDKYAATFPATLTPAQIVDALNARTGDPLNPSAGPALTQAERDQLVADLTSGAKTRGQVLRDVTENAEFRRRQLSKAFVLMQYFGYLRRAPNELPDTNFNGYNFWLGKLNEFGGNYIAAEMVKAFINSDEYRG